MDYKEAFKALYEDAKEKYDIQQAPKLFLRKDEENAKMIQQMLMNEADSKSSAWHSTSELWDDGVIDPRETRNYLGFGFAILYNQKIEGAKSYGVWRM